MLAEVTGVDLDSVFVDADCPGVGVRKVSFDYLVIALGVQPSYFGHDEFAKHAPSLKTLTDAEAIRAKILAADESAESAEDPKRASAANDLRAGRRRPDWRGIGGIDCANGHHHAAGEFQADLILRRPQFFCLRVLRASSPASRSLCQKRWPSGSRSSASRSLPGPR